uniref:helix-turn-helix domain-containing protein n=1 Tax=Flavobacterium sp. TaxID=239 RepID=UPI00404A9F71
MKPTERQIRIETRIQDTTGNLTYKEDLWLDSAEMKRHFNWSSSTLYRMRKAHEIPFTRIGKQYIYPLTQIMNMLAEKVGKRFTQP